MTDIRQRKCDMENPKVSILVPVYNTAQYLPKCLESLMNQTLREIEIIAVDDASPDNAAEVLREYAEKDSRIRIVTHEKNGGILAARISGIRAARGRYVMVLDADDTLDTDIARAAWEKAVGTGADIVHFRFNVCMENGRKTPFARHVERGLAPYGKPLLGERVFEGAFVDRLYRWNICGKLIAREVFLSAADALPPGYYIMAEDFCFYSLMSFFAKHYEPLMKKGYNYVLNIGVSAYVAADRKGFERSCSVFTALNAVHSFLERNGVFGKYEKAFRVQERLLLGDLFDRWNHRLTAGDRPAGFRYMLEHYEPNAVIASMAETFSELSEMETCALHLGLPEQLAASRRKRPRTAAVYLDRIAGSDIAAQLIAAAENWNGIETHFVSPEKTSGGGGPEILPFPGKPLAGAGPADRAERVCGWKKLLADHHFDAVIYAEPACGDMIWDILAIKAEGADVIVVPARDFDMQFSGRTGVFAGRAAAFRFADAVACFSPDEAEIHRFRGIRAAAVPAIPQKIARQTDGRSIVWTGSAGDMDALGLIVAAFAKGAKESGCGLVLCSPDVSAESERKFHELAEMFQLGDRARIVQGTDGMGGLLAEAVLLVAENDGISTETAARHTFHDFTPVVAAGTDQDILAGRIRGALNGDAPEKMRVPATGTWSELFDSLAAPPPARNAAAGIYERTLRGCYESSVQFERYAVEPPRKGDSFFSFYRFFDAKLAKWFPGGTRRRHFLFAGLRKIMRKLFGRG